MMELIIDNTMLALVFGVTTIVLILLAVYVWPRRDAPGGFYFTLLMVDGAFWSLMNMLQMLSGDMQSQILFTKMTYVGVVPAPVLWVLFNIAYSQRSVKLDKKLLLLWAEPIFILALVFTNEWHHLFWVSVTPFPGRAGSSLVFEFGIGMWVNLVYSYALMFIGTVMMAITSTRTYRRYFLQTVTLVGGMLIPYAGNIVYFVWLNQYAAFDPTSITLAIVGLIYAWSMFRYRLFDIVPVARETVISEMVDGIVVLDHRDRVLDYNPAARKLLGTDAKLGMPLAALLAPWPELLGFCIKAPPEWPAEVRLARPDGALWVEAEASPLHDNRGRVTGKLLVLRDITKRKTAEIALEESRRSFQTVFDAVDDLLFVLDENARIIEINPAVVRRLGYPREELLGADPRKVVPGGQFDEVLAVYNRKRSESPEAYPITLQARDGTRLQVETHVVPGLWMGKPAVFGIGRDITALMQHQEALRQSNRQLSAEVEERKRAEAQISSSLHEKEILLKEIHHRVKNNLQIVSSVLALQAATETREDVITVFKESQNRIRSMALVHEKIYQSPSLAQVNFPEYVQSLLGHLKSSYIVNPGVRLVATIDPLYMSIDMSIPCGLIINELVTNSIKYAFPGGRAGTITVSLTQRDGTYTLAVGDDGVGLPAGVDFRNSGSLGLQLVNMLVSQLEGAIALDASGGAKFTITFAEIE